MNCVRFLYQIFVNLIEKRYKPEPFEVREQLNLDPAEPFEVHRIYGGASPFRG